MMLVKTVRPLAVAALAWTLGCKEPPPPAPAPAPSSRLETERRELVLQPRRGYAPTGAAGTLSIQLISERSAVLPGEAFRYRLEIRNIGPEPVAFREPVPSFIKDGELCNGYRFEVALPGGGRKTLRRSRGCRKAGADGLDLSLAAGEYLLTRGSSLADRFRDLKTDLRFRAPGRYELRAVYAPAGGKPAQSTPVSFEVLPSTKTSGAPMTKSRG